MNESDRNLNSALEGVDERKRETLRRLIVKGAFVTPVVASFAMAGLTVEQAAAQTNQSTSGTFSDGRLKAVIARLGTHPAGFGIYRFRYLWGENEHVGVIAQEVREVMPEAVVCGEDGFLRVDYRAIGEDVLRSAACNGPTQPAPLQATAA
jgi:Chaperone of endosialidase